MIKTDKEIQIMRQSGKILAKIMDQVKDGVRPGVTTDYLNKVAEDLVFKSGAKPSFKGYQGFPAALCTSVNNEIVHMPPSNRVLKQGDIISLDLGVQYNGYHADMAITVPVGTIDQDTLRLVKVTKKALKRGIKKVRAGMTVGDIGNTIERYVTDQGYSVVKDLCGHGIGKNIHEEPQILNYGQRGKGFRLKENMVICLEPIVAIGGGKIQKTEDGSGFRTKDNSLSAHFEHTILVTKDNGQILTQ
tara:strand:+ start:944 stop:1681 length:738 start_codon:yes stop_codon:yes gene_type:complete